MNFAIKKLNKNLIFLHIIFLLLKTNFIKSGFEENIAAWHCAVCKQGIEDQNKLLTGLPCGCIMHADCLKENNTKNEFDVNNTKCPECGKVSPKNYSDYMPKTTIVSSLRIPIPPLHIAALTGPIYLVQNLIKMGANVKQTISQAQLQPLHLQPLHFAIIGEQFEIIKLFVMNYKINPWPIIDSIYRDLGFFKEAIKAGLFIEFELNKGRRKSLSTPYSPFYWSPKS